MPSPVQNTIGSRPTFSDGEGLTYGDLNALSGNARAYLNDLVLGALIRTRANIVGPAVDAAVAAAQLFALGHSGAPRNGVSANSFGCNAGPLFYVPTSVSIDGVTPQVRSYYLQTNEIAGTLAAGNATNPRFDAVYIRITDVDVAQTRDFQDATTGVVSTTSGNVAKQAKLEYQVVQGTAAAKPQVPAGADSTWALWGVWWVPATYSAAFQIQHIYDYRVPCQSYRRYLYNGKHWAQTIGSWTFDELRGIATSTSIPEEIVARLTCRSGRVMDAGATFLAANVGSYPIVQVQYTTGVSVGWDYPYRRTGWPNASMSSSGMAGYVMRGGVWYNTSLGVANTVQTTSSDGYALLPLWANGKGSEAEDLAQSGATAQDDTVVTCGWHAVAVGDVVYAATFGVAG